MNDKKTLLSDKVLQRAWMLLIVLTLASAFIAESIDPTAGVVIVVCLVVAIKGQLVVDRLMGLRHAPPLIRWMMLAYFYVLPLLIALALIFPEPLRRLTTL
ncbi:MAG: cytochrome C oxidase subunit IV family protein [Motiliproteus sp.]